MPLIQTSRGEMDRSVLFQKTGSDENADCITSWVEYRVAGDPTQEIVHRSVNVELKHGVNLDAFLGKMGG